MPSYTITLQRNGIIICRTEVPAVPAALIGDWFNGKCYKPDTYAVHDQLPYAYRKAFLRCNPLWWHDNSEATPAMPLRLDLYSLKNKPLGTLFASIHL